MHCIDWIIGCNQCFCITDIHNTQYIFRFYFYSVKNSNIVIKAVVLTSNTDYYYQFLYLLQHIHLRWWNFNFLSYHLRFIFYQWDRKKMLQYSIVQNVKCMFIQILTTKLENKDRNKILNLNDCLIDKSIEFFNIWVYQL